MIEYIWTITILQWIAVLVVSGELINASPFKTGRKSFQLIVTLALASWGTYLLVTQ